MTTPADPLAHIVFIEIPKPIAARLNNAIPPSLLIPWERPATAARQADVTVEGIIAGMLRVLIYQTAHPDGGTYATIVKALRPDILEEFTEAGRIKAEKKDFEIAIEIFRALTALFPENPVCAFNLALVYHDAARQAAGDREKAAALDEQTFLAYRAALALDKVLPDTYLNYGYFLLEQENYEKALVHFEEYLRLETDEEKKRPIDKIVANLSSFKKQDALFKEAFDDITMGKEESGIEKVSEVLEHHPDLWNGWFLLGWGQRRLGRYPAAKESFLKALSLTPPKPDLLNELAIVHMELGELRESQQRLIAAYDIEPDNIKVLSNLGIVSYKLERREEAAGFFRMVLELSENDPVARNYIEILEKN